MLESQPVILHWLGSDMREGSTSWAGSLNRPQRVKRNLKPQVCSHCEVTQTAVWETLFDYKFFLIHRKLRNLCESPFFKTRVWWPSQGISVILKENFPKETPRVSSEIGGIHQMLGCEEYFWISSSPLLLEWNLKTRLQNSLPGAFMDKVHFIPTCNLLGRPDSPSFLLPVHHLSSESLRRRVYINLISQIIKV